MFRDNQNVTPTAFGYVFIRFYTKITALTSFLITLNPDYELGRYYPLRGFLARPDEAFCPLTPYFLPTVRIFGANSFGTVYRVAAESG
jgi:hypothetical protein